jgi:hypothetical protein
MSNTPPMVLQLVSILRNQPPDRPEQLRGALEAVLTPELGAPIAKVTATVIVDQGAYDCPDALAEITPQRLSDMGIPPGRHTRVCQALFGADYGSGAVNPLLSSPVSFNAGAGPGGAAPYVMPAPIVNVTTAERVNRTTKASWPAPSSTATPSPEAYLDFGLALRTHFRESAQVYDAQGAPVGYTPDQFADMVYDRFSAPWTDIPAGHSSAGAHDKLLVAVLLKAPPGNIPPWAANLVRQQLAEDKGLEALLVLGRQIFTTTDLSDRMAKDAVRTPRPVANMTQVPRRLAQWDADWATVKARGFTVDDSDRRAGLLMLVSEVRAFKPSLAAMDARGTYTSDELRVNLGVVADRARSEAVAVKSAHAVGRVGAKPAKPFKAVKTLAAKVAVGGYATPLCHAFRDKGTCPRGPACKYSHDPKAVDNRKDFLAACALIYDEGQQSSSRAVIWAVALQALQMGMVLEPLMRIISFFTDSLTSGDKLACCGSVISPSQSVVHCCGTRSAFATTNRFAALAGPLADSGADCCFIGSAHGDLVVDQQPAAVCKVQTGNGVVELDTVATLPGAAGFMQHSYMLPGSVESLVSIGEICEVSGCGYTQDPGNLSARFWHPLHPGQDVELVRDGRLFRVPIDCSPASWALRPGAPACVASACVATRSKRSPAQTSPAVLAPGKRSSRVKPAAKPSAVVSKPSSRRPAAVKKPVAPVAQAPVLAPSTPPFRPQSILDPDAEPFVLSEAEAAPAVLPSAALEPAPVEDAGWYRTHCQQGHPYDARCDCCVRGRLKARPAKKIRPADRAAGDGYVMSADFTGIHDPDLDGHRVALVATV